MAHTNAETQILWYKSVHPKEKYEGDEIEIVKIFCCGHIKIYYKSQISSRPE